MGPELRRAIYERDRGICGICGEAVPWSDLHIDHVQARGAGGTHAPANLRTTHKRCNLSKIRADISATRAAIAAGIARPTAILHLRFDTATSQRLEGLSRKLSLRPPDVVRVAIAEWAYREGVRVPADAAPNGVAESR